MIDLLSLNKNEMIDLMAKEGFPHFRGKQLYQWCHEKEISNFDLMKNLPQDMRLWLKENAVINTGKEIKTLVGDDGNTIKFLLKFPCDVMVETVLMCYNRENSRNRNTVCISTQSGCNLKCKFCASAIHGLDRNLTVSEIIEQINYANKYLKMNDKTPVTNVVFMGMGEPFQNFDAVMKSINIINEAKNIGMRRITVSTCGLVNEIDKLADMKSQLTLAVSLHAPNNEVRNKLMPVNNKYPIESLFKSIDNYTKMTNRRVTIEYAIFKNVNDSESSAFELAALLEGRLVNVNLIPGNPVPETGLIQGEISQVNLFAKILNEEGIEAIVRESRGLVIDGACGQLRNRQIINDKHINL